MCHKKERLFSPRTWTNGIGFYINWNMVLADKNNQLPLEYPLEEPSWIPEFRKGIIDPIIPDPNGRLQPFSRPGLGFEINQNLFTYLQFFRVEYFAYTLEKSQVFELILIFRSFIRHN
jgi:L-alanine-DL-glutamate epimerase-like enolase superfamily enzyme